jgi:hypothetical protein
MRDRTPSLDIYCKVTNIGRGRLYGLAKALIGDESQYESQGRVKELQEKREAVRQLLRPSRMLRSEVIIHSELLRLQKQAGVKHVSEGHIDELSAYLDETLPSSFRESIGSAPATLPAKVEKLGRSGLVLSIAGSLEMLQRRALAKAAIADFYQLEVPGYIWSEDEGVTRAWLARSNGAEPNRLLNELAMNLEHDPDLLPKHSELGPITIAPNPHR